MDEINERITELKEEGIEVCNTDFNPDLFYDKKIKNLKLIVVILVGYCIASTTAFMIMMWVLMILYS